MIKPIKLLAGVTKENELYFLEIDPTNNKRNGYPEFTMSGFTVTPLELEDAKEKSYDSIVSLVEEETRGIRGLYLRNIDEIAREIVEHDGNLSGIDTSLYEQTVEVDGLEYVFESQACGQHTEDELVHYFIPEALFGSLMKAWELAHLKNTDKLHPQHRGWLGDVVEHAKQVQKDQDLTELAKRAIEIINQ